MGVRERYGKYAAIVVPDFEDAACRGSWLPANTWSNPRNDDERTAASLVCAGCRHLIECREFALSHPSLTGVWGAMNNGERAAERLRRRRQQQAGSAA